MATASLQLLKGKAKAAPAEELPEEEETPVEEIEETPAPVETADVEEEEVEIDVDKMTVPDLDALVTEHEIEVPAHWWKKDGDNKKMTGVDKKAWLKEQFEEGGEEEAPEAPDAPAQEEPEAEKPKAAAKKAAPKASTKAVQKASTEMTQVAPATSGEVMDPDELSNMIHEIENLKEKEARSLAAELAEHAEFTFFKLGGVLSVIQANDWFAPYATFKDYVQEERGIHYRKAMYLVSIYNDMTKASIPWAKVKHLGWTKMSIMSSVLTADNIDEWVKVAEDSNTLTLSELVSAAKKKDSGVSELGSSDTTSVSITTKTFKLHDDQKETVEAALAKAREDSGTDVDTVALEFIALDFLGSKKKSLKDQLKSVGIDKALEALDAAYPDANISVELPD